MKPAPETAGAMQAAAAAAMAPPARRRSLKLALLAVLLAVVAALPFLLDDYSLYIATQVMIYAIATLGLDILYGRTGQLSLAHASFFGVGAYVAALGSAMAWPIWTQPPAVVVLAVIGGAVVAIPTLRLSGLRLALVTLLFGELFTWAINHTGNWTGGSQGISVPPLVLGGFDSSVPADAYALAAVLAIMATVFCFQVSRTQYGRRMLAVRDSELASTSVGIPIARTKIVAFMLSAVLAGIAGWVYAYVVGFISPTTFDLFGSVYFLVAVILGGPGRVAGAWLGALYIVLVPEVFNTIGYPNLFPILGGGIMIVAALALPGGIVGSGAALAARLGSLFRGGARDHAAS